MGDTKKFRFAGVKVMLTYPGHLCKTLLTETVTKASNQPIKFIRCAHETGTSTGVAYEHTHCLVRWVNPLTTTDVRRFDALWSTAGVHPNWKPLTTETHWRNAVAYIAKEDPANADLLVKSCVPKIWAAESLSDALADNCRRPSDAPGIIALFNARPAVEVEAVARPDRVWQIRVLDFVEHTKPDRRSIHWYYDSVGGAGKTWLANFMCDNKLAYVVDQCGGMVHFATVLRGAVDSGWNQRCIIFDFPRDCEDYKFYGCLEQSVNGRATSIKYQGATFRFNQPHVLVFANFLPQRDKMSADRWRIHHLSEADCLVASGDALSPLPPSELAAHPPAEGLPGCLTLKDPLGLCAPLIPSSICEPFVPTENGREDNLADVALAELEALFKGS